jgi:hypothetical protein
VSATEEHRAEEIPAPPVAPVVSNPTAPKQDEEMESQQDEEMEPQDEQRKKTIELTRPRKSGPLEILERAYEDQSRDASAMEVEKLIREQFGDEHLPTEFLHNVTCHEKVCKIEMYWTEDNPLVLMALAMKTGPLLTGYIAFVPDPGPDREGRTLVTVYILREGDLADL